MRKEMLVPAFRKLRERGILARHTRLACCGTCCGLELGNLSDQYVGYHVQSVPDKLDDEWSSMYLQHGIDDCFKPFVRETLQKAGFVVDWDGSNRRTIHISLPHPEGHYWGVVRRAWRARFIFNYWLELATGQQYAPGGCRASSLADAMGDGGGNDDDPPLPPPGVTPAFDEVGFLRTVRFGRPMWSPDWSLAVLDGPPPWWGRDDEMTESWNSLSDDEKEQLCWWHMGCDVASIELSDPEVFDETKDELHVLKGAELDAVAFVGDVLRMRCYSHLGDKAGGKDYTHRREIKAPRHRNGQRYFTVAELHRALGEPLLWLARCEQFAKSYSPDHCFFEGLCHHEEDDSYSVHWGS